MIVIFEDAAVDALAPMTVGRLACTVSCGGFQLLEVMSYLASIVPSAYSPQAPLLLGITRPYLQAIQEADYPQLASLNNSELDLKQHPLLLINARVLPAMEYADNLKFLITEMRPSGLGAGISGVIYCGEQIAAIINPPWTLQQLKQAGHDGISQLLQSARQLPTLDTKLELIRWPHEVIAHHMVLLASNLQYRLRLGDYEQLQDGVFVASGAKLGDYLSVDTKLGPIVIDRDAQVGPYTLLRGPVYLGPKCRILEHAAIKDAVSLGHTTKIGGEVEASIVEPFSNKQHHGFLGHSYLGSWINLGAGTCNSDLKNTYGTVNMEYPAGKATTGMQFLGCVMGNYSKTAINTGIFTGKVIGACSMMYGFVTSNVPSFVNYARLFGQVATLPPEVMVATQARMFSRRQVKQRPCDIQLIHDMYRLTQEERDRFPDLLSL